jgi:hypothetical protein
MAGLQPPQPVAAPVTELTPSTVDSPQARIAPRVTPLQAHTSGSGGSPETVGGSPMTIVPRSSPER